MTDVAPRYSVVVPVFNEAAALPALAEEVAAVMRRMDGGWECIIVDDGSTDATAACIDRLTAPSGSPFRCVRFARNRGQAAALYAGLRRARGELVVVLDGDGQNPPEDIPRLVEMLVRDGLDLVCGIRIDRQDGALRRVISRVANGVRSRFLRDRMRDSGCALKVMRRAVVAALPPIRTLYSFIPAFAVAAGFTVGECAVGHRARQGGESSYGLRVFLWRPLVDMLGVRWYGARLVLERSDLVEPDSDRRSSSC
ncbi:MAG TPA: glycosyltransferase family 2 protein [Candidatus Binatia bacterium]|nr:glycosyltransferase family 2 protein [Candidatus Binatia bacterium]